MVVLTPEETLKTSKTLTHAHVLQFPVLLMENVLKSLAVFTVLFKLLRTGKDVPAKCRIRQK